MPYCDKKIVIPFERSPFKVNNLKAIKKLRKVIQKEHYDIIHTHTPMGSVVTRLAAKKARRNGTRVIYTAHGFHFFKGAPLLNWCLFYPVEKYLSKYTDTLILINQEDYQRAKKKFKKCKDIVYVPGVGIDEEKFNFQMSEKEKLELRESLGLKKDDFVLVYSARLDKNKNQIMIIKVMKKICKEFNNIHLLIAGKDERSGYYQKIVKNELLTSNIHFLGFRNDIPNILRASDLAISTSIREGLGLNLIEANRCGLPVVATDNRGHKDIVKNGENGYLVSIDDIDSMKEKIVQIYSNKDLYEYMSKKSLEMSRKFALKSIINKIEGIYERV